MVRNTLLTFVPKIGCDHCSPRKVNATLLRSQQTPNGVLPLGVHGSASTGRIIGDARDVRTFQQKGATALSALKLSKQAISAPNSKLFCLNLSFPGAIKLLHDPLRTPPALNRLGFMSTDLLIAADRRRYKTLASPLVKDTNRAFGSNAPTDSDSFSESCMYH